MATTLTMSPPNNIKPAGHSSPQISNTSSGQTPSAIGGADEEADGEKSTEKGDADIAAPAVDLSMSGALQQKISELQASGWRPPEETIDSDDDYNAVDYLSDSDDEEKRMRKVEEKMMAVDDDEEDDAALARRLSLSSASSNTTNMAYLELNDDYLLNDINDTPFSQSFLDADQPMNVSNSFSEQVPLARTHSAESATTQRRVRFEDKVDMSDNDGNTTDSDADSDFFPDLFIQQDHLDPKFRRLIEKDDDHELYRDDSSNAGSEWDFEADEMRLLLMDEDDEEESDSSAGSSGYESDDGDTTDEEPMPPPPKKLLKEASTAPTSPSSNAATPKVGKLSSRKLNNKRAPASRQPKMGTFIIDPHRPVLTIDGIGSSQKSTLWPAKIQSQAEKKMWQRMHLLSNTNSRANSRNTSPRQSISVHMTPTGDSDGAMSTRGMSIDSGNDFFDSFGALRTDQVIGPPEAFAPFVDVTAAGNIVQDDAVAGASEQDQDPMCFLNFDDDDEDEDMPDESDNLASPSTTASFPHLSTNSSSKGAGFDLLAHLDRRGVVGSFRRNQLFARQVGSLPSHPALRASLSETNAMQTGRRAAANTPITPLRKKKAKGVGLRNSPVTSPLTKSPPLKKKGPVRGGFSRR